MKLFTTEKIQKFFFILKRMDRHVSNIWVNPFSKSFFDENKINYYCQKEVFVRRTVNKWLKNKLLVLYKTAEPFDYEYKQFIKINKISFVLSWGNELCVEYYNYSTPETIFNHFNLDVGKTHNLEGEWSIDETNHNIIKDLCSMNDLPIKKYVFKALKTNNLKKEVFLNFYAKTEKEAYKFKHFEQKINKNIIIYPDIFEIV